MIAENPGTGLKKGRDMPKRIMKLAANMKQSLKDQLVRYRIDFLHHIDIDIDIDMDIDVDIDVDA